MTKIEFTVLGLPQPAGSKRAFPIWRKDGRLGVSVVDTNKKVHAWKNAVAIECRKAYDGPLLTGPISLRMVFYSPRPKWHFGTGKNSSKLKDSAPAYPTVKPDVLKMGRAGEDGCTAIAYCDDAQVVDLHVRKFYGEPARTEFTIIPIVGVEGIRRPLEETPQADPSSSTTSVA